ncbi:MAG: hypothetical protein ACXWUD_05560 [Methylosarcina sp.]
MLEDLFSMLNAPVPPVPPTKNHGEPLKPKDGASVPRFPQVPPEKMKAKIEYTKITAPASEDAPPLLNPKDRAAILRWLHYLGENSQPIIDNVLEYCATNPEALTYYLKRAMEIPHD